LKVFIVLVLLAIVGNLGSALYYLLKDRDRSSPRTVKALTIRIGLSIALFFLLILAYGLGLIQPHGLHPGVRSTPPNSAPSEAPKNLR
jgi:hypothetical protein